MMGVGRGRACTYDVCYKKEADGGLELIAHEAKIFFHAVQSVSIHPSINEPMFSRLR